MSNYVKVILTEEGMRDGLQIERAGIPVADKIRLLDALSDTGLKEIAVGSFVSPRWVPQMADIDELVRGFHPKPGVSYTATALNDMGRERLRQYIPPLNDLKYQAQTAAYLCDVFAQRNINRTIAQQVARWPKAVEEAKSKGAKEAGISISAAWGSNWTGEVTQEDRMKMLERQHRLWDEAGIPVTKVGISDPMGWNVPDQVERQLEAIKKRWPAIKSFNLHLHNTRGMALVRRRQKSRRLRHAALAAGHRRHGRLSVLRQWPVRRPGADGRSDSHDGRHGYRYRRRPGKIDRSGLACGRSDWPSALGPCLQRRAAADWEQALRNEHAVRRNIGSCPPFHQRTRRIPGRAVAVERGDQEPAAC
jgi:hypothetical protein